MSPETQEFKADIVIVGGGIIGSAAAYFLAIGGRAGRVAVIEPDPSYERAATPAGAGGVRRLMSRVENIQMSQFSLDFYAKFEDSLGTDIQFKRQGYLFLATKDGAAVMEQNFETQRQEGVDAELLDLPALQSRFPSVGVDNVALACHSPRDGWIDPYAALMGFRKKAESLGVSYIKDRVIGLETSKGAVSGARLESGGTLRGAVFLNTAGPWAAEVAAMIGATLPVRPMCRVQHYWRCGAPLEPLPLIKDETGAFLRPEGAGFVGGRPSWAIDPGFVWEVDRGYFATYFEDTVWPLLAAMVPKFETIRLERTWGGHYAQNLFDGNMIIGRFSEGFENFYTACGFSGHGIMHAPAVGRALAELALAGQFETLDLSRMGMHRIWDDSPYPELGIR
ncbi:MAG: FAD-binding oxidoreductase [Pseudomonadota bacterium]